MREAGYLAAIMFIRPWLEIRGTPWQPTDGPPLASGDAVGRAHFATRSSLAMGGLTLRFGVAALVLAVLAGAAAVLLTRSERRRNRRPTRFRPLPNTCEVIRRMGRHAHGSMNCTRAFATP